MVGITRSKVIFLLNGAYTQKHNLRQSFRGKLTSSTFACVLSIKKRKTLLPHLGVAASFGPLPPCTPLSHFVRQNKTYGLAFVIQ